MALTDRYVSSSGSGTYVGSTSSATPMSLTTALANAVAGDRINIKADGTYARSGDTATNSGTATSPIIYRGYKTTIGDGFQGRTNGNGALVTTNMPTINETSGFLSVNNFVIVESLIVTTAGGGGCILTGTNCLLKSCVMSSGTAGDEGTSAGVSTVIFDCDISLTNVSGGGVDTSANSRVLCNRINAPGAFGVNVGAASVVVAGNTIFSSGGAGAITVSGANCFIASNTIVSESGSGDGINASTGATGLVALNNMTTDNGGYGINTAATIEWMIFYNRYRDNTSGTINGAADWTAATNYAPVTSGAGTSDYTNSGSHDYSLQSTSPAVQVGWPNYAAIGALQQKIAAAGMLYVPNLDGV